MRSMSESAWCDVSHSVFSGVAIIGERRRYTPPRPALSARRTADVPPAGVAGSVIGRQRAAQRLVVNAMPTRYSHMGPYYQRTTKVGAKTIPPATQCS